MKLVSRVCGNCGERILGDEPKGLCPACVLETGLGPLADQALAGIDSSAVASAKADDPGPTAGVLMDFGDYELLEEIGRGGQGVVYRAHQKSLNRTVALKVIGLGQWATQAHLKRFRREAEAAARLEHPGIVPIHEVGERDGSCYFSMQFIEGGQLDEVVRLTPMSIRQAVELVAKVARTVHYAHEHGILHRDIKPGNILLDAKGEPHLTDFGLARLVETENTMTRTLDVLGTPSYMAPEQAMGNNAAVNGATDIYGLGAVIYQLLTGQPPFSGGATYETIRLLIDTEPKQPRLLNPKIDRDLGTICLKCLEKDPKRRYSSALALAEDLERWLKHEPIQARRAGVFARGEKWLRRNPSSTLLLASLFALVAASGWIVATQVFPFFEIPHWAVFLVILLSILGFPIARILAWASQSTPGGIKREADSAFVVADSMSLVVLPFANQTGDPEQEHFCDGLTEELINRLGRMRPLLVIGRNSSFALKGRTQDSRAIGQILGVANLLEGSVRKFNGRVRITVGLVRARDGSQLWTENYDRELKDVFAVQEEIASAVGEQLRVTLLGAGGTAQRARALADTKVAEAHHLYFCGRYHWGKRTEAGLQAAIKDFNAAIDIDPGNARSWAGLADCYTILGCWGYESPHKSYPKARAAAERALELDDTLSEAHVSLAVGKKDYYWDWVGAEQEYRRALELNPSNVMARQWHAEYLSCLGRHSEAIAEAERGRLLDPLALVVAATLGRHGYGFARQYDRAVEELREAVRIDSDFWMAHLFLGFTHMYQEQFDEALAEFALAQQLEQNGDILAGTGYALGRSGRKAEARQVLAEIMKLRQGRYVQAVVVALVHIGLGEKDEAFFWLEEAFTERAQWLTEIKADPAFDSLRADARLEQLLQRIGLA